MLKRVYVFEYDGKFKIGVSDNVVNRRSALSCACPGIKEIYESEYISNPFKVERLLHKIFSDFSIGGEWFSFVDIEKVKRFIDEFGVEGDLEEEKRKRCEISENIANAFGEMINADYKKDYSEKELDDLKSENEQIEKFTTAVRGCDIPNIYSDLIYEVLFGTDTQGMIKKYKPEKFESFRKKLTNEQNKEIDNLTSLIGGLINYYWDFSKIEEFVKTKIHPKSASVQK